MRVLAAALLAALTLTRAPHPLSVVIVGDSVAHGQGDESGRGLAIDLDRELDGLGIAHLASTDAAVSGSRTWQLAARLLVPRVRELARKADAIVVSIGGNDLYGDGRARLLSGLAPSLMMDLTLDRIESIVGSLHRLNARARVILVGLYDPYRLPSLDRQVARWNARLLDRFSDDARVTVIPIADLFIHRDRLSPVDRFHPSADGYVRIARRIAETL
jgi:lysophospholipase L1-like esterase